MANRDIKRNLAVFASLAGRALNVEGTGTRIDTQGYDGVMVLCSYGTWQGGTAGTMLVELQESVAGTTFTAVPAASLLGTFTPITGTAFDDVAEGVGYIGTCRYLRPVLTLPGNGGGTGVTAVAFVLGYPAQRPV